MPPNPNKILQHANASGPRNDRTRTTLTNDPAVPIPPLRSLNTPQNFSVTLTMAANPNQILQDVNVLGPLNDKTSTILSKDAAVFLALLHRTFNETRKALLQRRVVRQAELDKGYL